MSSFDENELAGKSVEELEEITKSLFERLKQLRERREELIFCKYISLSNKMLPASEPVSHFSR